MRRLVLSVVVGAAIVLVPVVVYVVGSGTDGTALRATIGSCSRQQRTLHRVACKYIDRQPAIELAGPIDETGTPFANVLHRADGQRKLDLRLDSGRYAVFLEVDHHRTIRANVRAVVDLSTGGRDLGTLTPAEPWELTGVPGS